MAQLGKLIFYDASLSSSGRLSCSSCHDPRNFYGPPNDAPAMFGGPTLAAQGVRAVPSLMYLQIQPNFSIGPDPAGDNETPAALPQLALNASTAVRAQKTAQSTAQSATNMVPVGGLFWDGRVDTLQSQAMGPLLSPYEMDGGNADRVAAKLQNAPYADRFIQLFGPAIFASPKMAVAEAMFAVARYQIEDPSFHPYSSKYDAWLEGKAKADPGGDARLRAVQRPGQGRLRCLPSRSAFGRRPTAFVDRPPVRGARCATQSAACR
jgi:cytochrome c peroxidase